MRASRSAFFLVLGAVFLSSQARAFCGFYVAKADASLYNEASQVVLVREGDKTAITMFNDYKGSLNEFALVVPVPEVLTREQINVADKALLERVDAFSAPRLVEYFDPDPCAPNMYLFDATAPSQRKAEEEGGPRGKGGASHGVTIEARYTVGEYDILILSAKESGGLGDWLKENGYKMPKGVAKALAPYVKQKMKFFVAKVNLKEQTKTGFSYLRPLQFAFESPKFMLPIRLGMANATGPQDLIVFAITRKGRVETTNYRTVKLPTGMNIPEYVKDEFAGFYKAMFETSHKKENQKVVFLEYAWNMNWCDPCAADPLTAEELRKLGVFWQADAPSNGQGASEAFLSRLHVRYDAAHFPEDLFFQETSDTDNFQGRYVMNHPWKNGGSCPQLADYLRGLKDRHDKEAQTLAMLTGWDIGGIRKKMGTDPASPDGTGGKKWYQKIFK